GEKDEIVASTAPKSFGGKDEVIPGPQGNNLDTVKTEPSWGQVIGGAVKNAWPSFKANIGDPLLSNPGKTIIETPKGVGTLGKGLLSASGHTGNLKLAPGVGIESLKEKEPTPEIKEQRQQDEAPLKAVRDFYVKRYGSMEGFKKALMQDPLAVGMDA